MTPPTKTRLIATEETMQRPLVAPRGRQSKHGLCRPQSLCDPKTGVSRNDRSVCRSFTSVQFVDFCPCLLMQIWFGVYPAIAHCGTRRRGSPNFSTSTPVLSSDEQGMSRCGEKEASPRNTPRTASRGSRNWESLAFSKSEFCRPWWRFWVVRNGVLRGLIRLCGLLRLSAVFADVTASAAKNAEKNLRFGKYEFDMRSNGGGRIRAG